MLTPQPLSFAGNHRSLRQPLPWNSGGPVRDAAMRAELTLGPSPLPVKNPRNPSGVTSTPRKKGPLRPLLQLYVPFARVSPRDCARVPLEVQDPFAELTAFITIDDPLSTTLTDSSSAACVKGSKARAT